MMNFGKPAVWVVAAAVALGAVGAVGVWQGWWPTGRSEKGEGFLTAPVKRGDVIATISATGTIEPEEVIDIGAQVAGQILAFGKDAQGKTIDYGSQVEAGMVLAQIDDSLYTADAATSAAQLLQAQAQLASANAKLEQFQAKQVQARNDWERAQKIGPSDALAQSAYDAYKAADVSAAADVTAGQAAILQARGAIAQAEASVQRTKRNLAYCVIKSPVKGVIIDRRVNIGQTVVASLNTPSLFLLAKDLRRIQIWIAVNEADIGQIKPGQPVTFTVDAFPSRVFKGEVGKVRLNATMTQNVVTYTVEVVADNADGQLLPYLTANAKFLVGKHEGVLTVPNAALRWTPPAALMAPAARGADKPGRGRGGASAEGVETGTRGTVWVPDGAGVKPVRLRTGLSDGTVTEILDDKLPEGSAVVIATARPAGAAGRDGDSNPGGGTNSDTVNPFAPKLPFRGGRH